jgi:secondary thiamine-phosphate synthase enzyme
MGSARLHPAHISAADIIATAGLTVETAGDGPVEITEQLRRFVEQIDACDGVVLVFLRHTSASLTIQENADPDVQTDLRAALRRLAPEEADWVHDVEGPDDMPSHVKTMLTGVSLHVPVIAGALALGTWQGVYVLEHRARPHRREVVLQFVGTRGAA